MSQIQHTYDTTNNFLYAKSRGLKEFQDIVDHYNRIRLDKSYPRKLRVFIDAQNTEIQFKPSEIQSFVESINLALDEYESICEAILVEKPIETAIATLFKDEFSHFKYEFAIFNTEYAAVNWLKSK